jgi:hypothetical protein
MDFDVSRLPALLAPDRERIRTAKRRQADLFAGRKPDRWPIVCAAPLTPAQEAIPPANYEEAFRSPERTLCSEVRDACLVANAKSDGVPSIRANLGTGICLSTLGLSQLVFPDKMPWLQEHLTREAVAKLTPDDVRIRGDFQRGLEMMRFFRRVMGDSLDVYCMDTQGPFDLAHLLVGDDIFYLPYDDPGLMHHVMEIALEVGIRTHTWMKEASGEPRDRISHRNALYAENMGVRICEDTTAMVSREMMDEFVMPYTRRLAEHFGGAWVHYCGRNDHLTEAICGCEAVRAVNFGIIPGRPHEHDFEREMERFASAGKVYYGHWPRFDGESRRDWLSRIHRWSARGVLLESVGQEAVGEGGFATVAQVLEHWYGMQEGPA